MNAVKCLKPQYSKETKIKMLEDSILSLQNRIKTSKSAGESYWFYQANIDFLKSELDELRAK